MKQLFHKIIASLMAIVVLLSTMSFTIDLHYCGGVLVETALFHKAKGCGMEISKPLSEGCSISKKSCCSDKQIIIDGQDELKIAYNTIAFDQQQFIASFIYTYVNLFECSKKDIKLYTPYKPPLIIRPIFKFDETYLI